MMLKDTAVQSILFHPPFVALGQEKGQEMIIAATRFRPGNERRGRRIQMSKFPDANQQCCFQDYLYFSSLRTSIRLLCHVVIYFNIDKLSGELIMMSAGAERLWNVLILGDGNFSFSLSLVGRLNQLSRSRSIKLFCTSFDSYDDVIDKYPESKTILKRLEKDPRCQVVHSVNATTIRKHFPEDAFNEIIFNFPHLGFEDLHSHRALVAHYFHSALECQAPDGYITVALSSDQSEKWEIHQTGLRLGLECVSANPIVTAQWPGYMLKRHHTGKSFATRVNDLHHFIFARMSESKAEHGLSILQEFSVSAAAAESHPAPSIPVSKENKKKGKKRVHLLVEGKYVESGSEFLCQECQRTFPTEQGVRTHVYNVHILAPDKKQSTAAAVVEEEHLEDAGAASWRCADCDKDCPDEDALKQHKIAKHTGNNLYILPYWKTSSLVDAPGSEEVDCSSDKAQCSVCLLHFDSQAAMQAHMSDGLIPVVSATASSELLVCEICNKQFSQERALLQHKNFCAQRGLQNTKPNDSATSTHS